MRNSKDFSIEYIEYCGGISRFIRKGAFVCTQPKAPVYPPRPHTGRTADLPQGRDNAQDTPFRWPPGAERVQRSPTGRLRTKTPRAGAGVQAVLPLWPHYCQYDTPRVPLWARGPGSPQTTLTCDWVQRGACSEGRDHRNSHSFSSFFHSGLQPDRYKNRQFT